MDKHNKIEIDKDYIRELLKSQYGYEAMSITPVSLSFSELQSRINPGRICFFGWLDINSTILNTHVTPDFRTWYVRFLGAIKWQYYAQAFGTPSKILFDDLFMNLNALSTHYDYDDIFARATEISVSIFKLTASPFYVDYNVPAIYFNGYQIQIGR